MQLLRKDMLSARFGKGQSFGTFGELLQGVGSNEQDFLVTLPINRFSTVRYVYDANTLDVVVSPSNKQKSKSLACLILEHFGLPVGGVLELDGNLPVGKGLASSSADLVATARAIDDCFDLNLSPEQIQFFIKQIEPTDGVMYDGVVSYYHRNVQLREYLGQLPNLTILGLDEGGEVDTVEFNKLPKPFSPEERHEYDELLSKISQAIRLGDLQTIGEVATRSAMLNQKLRWKKQFEQVLSICRDVDGLGVVVAHSGTCLGILLSPENPAYDKQLYAGYEAMRQLEGETTIYYAWNEPQASQWDSDQVQDVASR